MRYEQIENEYQTIEGAFHDKGPPYVRWAAEMAVGLNTGVPWMMCKQDDAPDPVVSPPVMKFHPSAHLHIFHKEVIFFFTF